MNKGIASRWIDVYENEGKTSGAYSFGSYDSMPYILMNFSSTLKDVFTLVHEMGHSMHSSYTRQYQPFIYGSHSIFTAEVASTVNESLLMRYLLDNETDPEMRKYLLNMYIEEFRTTLFRQTMFAEFEDMTHKAIENGEVLTADWLNENIQCSSTPNTSVMRLQMMNTLNTNGQEYLIFILRFMYINMLQAIRQLRQYLQKYSPREKPQEIIIWNFSKQAIPTPL